MNCETHHNVTHGGNYCPICLLNERDALKLENTAMREALEKIEKMPWADSESPYAVIARNALGRKAAGEKP